MDIKKYKYILIDLWGTIFIEDTKKLKNINRDRAEILCEYTDNKDIDFWYGKIIRNIKNFKIAEKKGQSIRPIDRIKDIMHIEDKKIIEEILKRFDELYYTKYTPAINYKLLDNISCNQKLILISNTGLTTKKCIIKILKQNKIYDKFSKFCFSEDYDVCKPNIDFYLKALENIKSSDVIMIGDDEEMDLKPCKQLKIKCILKNWRE